MVRRRYRLAAAALSFALAAGGTALVAHATAAASGKTRTYYIAAETVAWNYAPSGKNLVTGKPFGEVENVFVKRGPGRIGHVYLKAVYRAYTDASFTHRVKRSARWEHLGLLGPVIHAEVGDKIRIVFKNKLRMPASIHPHGVFYKKNAEGAPYADGTDSGDKRDDGVPPGKTYTYDWRVPERSGPGPMDGSSIVWMYHSHADEVADTNAGLVGAIVITRKGMARPDGSPKDVDREFVTYFSVINENQSPLLQANTRKFIRLGSKPLPPEEFEESNLMHSINGFVYGNLPGLKMRKGEKVRWYVMDLGTEVDLHTPHWHGNVITSMGMRNDMLQLLPGSMMVADMQPDDPGAWLLHCHVNDHIIAGMQALYTVES